MSSMTGAQGRLDDFRWGVYRCLTRRADALFELIDAVLCVVGPVTDLARLSVCEVYARGHGALYDALNAGCIRVDRLRELLAGLPLARFVAPGGDQIVLAVDTSNWLRPDAATSPERSFCHVYARGHGNAQMIPGWVYLFIVALTPGVCSWTQILDVQRVGPDDDATMVTAQRLRAVVEALVKAGAWRPGDVDVLVVLDAGFDVCRLAWVLADLPVTLVARVRSDRVFCAPAHPAPATGRPPRHGAVLACVDALTWTMPTCATSTWTTRYGRVLAMAWEHMHPKLAHRSAWAGHRGQLPIIEGTLVRLSVQRLPGDAHPQPLWLWCSKPTTDIWQVNHWWAMYLRRFDVEHTFRFLKQQLGWTAPMLRDPAAADRWTWCVVVAYAQLNLARPLACDVRLPWQRPLRRAELTPGRVRAGFRDIHKMAVHPASAPKPAHPGPGRPKGSQNQTKAPIQPVGKTDRG